jgi:hypothetical protein
MLWQYKIDLENKKPNTLKKKVKLIPEKVFKIDDDDFERLAEKGMDFAWYTYNWLLTDLYPYYHKVRKANPDCEVYLVEDNSGAHTKARRLLSNHPLQKLINFAPHPGNSPDLHPIERVFDKFEDALQDYVPKGKSIAEKNRAMRRVEWEWVNAETWGSTIEREADAQTFLKYARRCLNKRGGNTFHG